MMPGGSPGKIGGAAPIADGDVVECRIDGFETLMNPVRDLKRGVD